MMLCVIAGCQNVNKQIADSASQKNINMDGFLSLGEIETSNADTGTPQGRFIVGRLTYRSRKVGIPADQKVPTTGYFRAVETESLLGSKEKIIEYDFTAGSDAEAAKALEVLEQKRKNAQDKIMLTSP